MKIDISRVNLLEKDIEDWLYENPQALYSASHKNPITRWIGRQYPLPSGIVDLIGIREDLKLVVVEIKNVPINKAAVLQVCRYANDLKEIVTQRMDYPFIRDWSEPVIEMIVAGPSIEDQTFTEADAVGVRVFTFAAEVNVKMSSLGWTSSHRDKLYHQYSAIAARPEWSVYGLTISEDIEQAEREAKLKQDGGEIDHSDPQTEEAEYMDDGSVIIRGAHLGEGYSDVILLPNDAEESDPPSNPDEDIQY